MSFKSLLGKIENKLSQPRLRLFRTIYFNFRLLPWSQAIKLPVFLYGPVRFYWLTGSVEIKAPVKRGMIKLGQNFEFFNAPDSNTFILLLGKLIFHGPCKIANNYKLRVSKDGVLHLGKYTSFGSGLRIVCVKSIIIEDYSRFAFDSSFIDSDFHFLLDRNINAVQQRDKAIYIGKYNWGGNTVSYNKGTITQDYTTIASKSLLNKDYRNPEAKEIMLAGSPCKIVREDIRRIFSLKIETELYSYFKNNESASLYEMTELSDETESLEKKF